MSKERMIDWLLLLVTAATFMNSCSIHDNTKRIERLERRAK